MAAQIAVYPHLVSVVYVPPKHSDVLIRGLLYWVARAPAHLQGYKVPPKALKTVSDYWKILHEAPPRNDLIFFDPNYMPRHVFSRQLARQLFVNHAIIALNKKEGRATPCNDDARTTATR